MKLLVVIVFICSVCADTAEKQDVKPKTPSSPQLNTIQQSPKYEMIYQPIKYQQQQPPQSPQQKYIPVQLIPKPYYVPASQAQPHAMIIIAQPALLPQSVVYGNPTQQLLNYFHNNPQAKYQLLHGNYQQPQQQTTYMHQVVASPSIGNYILAPAPQYQVQPQYQHQAVQYQTAPATASQAVQYQAASHAPQTVQYQAVASQAAPAQYQASSAAQYQASPAAHYQQLQAVAPSTQYLQTNQLQAAQHQPQLSSLAQIAQIAAQQYASSKSAPAIVTGFENFTPEQQAQIKQQLNAHLGNNYHALSADPSAPQYSSKYNAEPEETNEFVPSPQVGSKTEEASDVASSSSTSTNSRTNIMKAARYNKG